MSDILQRIAAYKREEVAHRRLRCDRQAMQAKADATPTRGFLAALRQGSAGGACALIAEVKKASPSKGLIREPFDPEAIARAYAAGGASCLSVLTDAPSFMGSEEALVAARAATDLPVLRKEFLVDRWQVLESRAIGADAILVILALVEDGLAADLIAEAEALGMDALVEVHDESELDRALRLAAALVGVNNRDLRTFETRLATTARLAARVPPSALLVSESGIFTAEDVAEVRAAGASAVLVGEALMREVDVEAATRTLLASPKAA